MRCLRKRHSSERGPGSHAVTGRALTGADVSPAHDTKTMGERMSAHGEDNCHGGRSSMGHSHECVRYFE